MWSKNPEVKHIVYMSVNVPSYDLFAGKLVVKLVAGVRPDKATNSSGSAIKTAGILLT